jgi:hypothetical protein
MADLDELMERRARSELVATGVSLPAKADRESSQKEPLQSKSSLRTARSAIDPTAGAPVLPPRFRQTPSADKRVAFQLQKYRDNPDLREELHRRVEHHLATMRRPVRNFVEENKDFSRLSCCVRPLSSRQCAGREWRSGARVQSRGATRPSTASAISRRQRAVWDSGAERRNDGRLHVEFEDFAQRPRSAPAPPAPQDLATQDLAPAYAPAVEPLPSPDALPWVAIAEPEEVPSQPMPALLPQE